MNLYSLTVEDNDDKTWELIWGQFLKIPYEYNTIFHCGAAAGPTEAYGSVEVANRFSLILKNKNFDFVWVDTENFYNDGPPSTGFDSMSSGRIERIKDYAQKSNENIFVYDYELKQDEDSISNVLNDNGFSNNLALLVLDLDSIDYYALKNFKGDSEVIICEFNPGYGKYLTTYKEGGDQIGNYGASMHAMCFALKDRNYKIFGFDGPNIIFVKQKFEYIFTEELLSFETEDELDLIWENWKNFNSDSFSSSERGYDKVLRSVKGDK